jgi:hypothetical protein
MLLVNRIGFKRENPIQMRSDTTTTASSAGLKGLMLAGDSAQAQPDFSKIKITVAKRLTALATSIARETTWDALCGFRSEFQGAR